MILAPSILAADFLHLEEQVMLNNESESDWLHVDIMDGAFVPNISFGPMIVKAIHEVSEKPLDVHLMIEDPARYIGDFVEAGAASITVHVEACRHLHSVIRQIKEYGVNAGVAINPHTPPSGLEYIIAEIDLVCLMSVNPGFGGQKFIQNSLLKIRKTKNLIDLYKSNALIEVDGGVGLQNASSILQAGADVLVAGSSVYKADDPLAVISQLKKMGVDNHIV